MKDKIKKLLCQTSVNHGLGVIHIPVIRTMPQRTRFIDLRHQCLLLLSLKGQQQSGQVSEQPGPDSDYRGGNQFSLDIRRWVQHRHQLWYFQSPKVIECKDFDPVLQQLPSVSPLPGLNSRFFAFCALWRGIPTGPSDGTGTGVSLSPLGPKHRLHVFASRQNPNAAYALLLDPSPD